MSFLAGLLILAGVLLAGSVALWAALMRDEPATPEPWWWPGPDQPQTHDNDDDEGTSR